MKIVVVGAGIGGLTLALSLRATGNTDVTVYERAKEVRGLGVGINLLPHAMRELTEIGMADRIAGIGTAPHALAYYNRHGQQIWREPRGLAAGYRWPQQSVHRGELQLALRDAVQERLGDVIRLDNRLTDLDAAGKRPRARFDSAGQQIDVEADLIVAAEGIHSAARAMHYPAEGAPPWSGLTLWRGIADAPVFLDGRTMIMAGDGEQKFVAYPLSAPDASGRSRINFIAELRGPGVADADWNRAVDASPIAELFRDWRFDWIDVPAIIRSSEELFEYPMVDRDPLPRWTFGRTTLLGDAAHAMYPNGSNGASQAIIDARTLAFHLATAGSIDEALAAYELDRRPAMTSLLASTRSAGPERVMQIAAERAPRGFVDIHDVIAADELDDIANGYKRAAGFLPELLNARPSLTPGAAS
ncbi:flavin-dependent oxidoreductase [Microbacterium aoyamense]|uniref:Flavin-dependent oxidoreductase n=1 Tax=Microbacterium aoyamense TaxID=344166 RepID=A0ABN2PBN1_9MICO|nr:flavin-dependent oxidoreductase [Microbacterium aoyamense]